MMLKDFYVAYYHDEAGDWPTLEYDIGKLETWDEVLKVVRENCDALDYYAYVFFGEDVVIYYDNGTFCGTDIYTSEQCAIVCPDGSLKELYM